MKGSKANTAKNKKTGSNASEIDESRGPISSWPLKQKYKLLSEICQNYKADSQFRNLKTIKDLLAGDIDINYRSYAKRVESVPADATALHILATNTTENCIPFATCLLDHGADRNVQLAETGYSPYLFAVHTGKIDFVRFYIERYPYEKNVVNVFAPVGTYVIVNNEEKMVSSRGKVIQISSDGKYDVIIEEVAKPFTMFKVPGNKIQLDRSHAKSSYLDYGYNALHVASESQTGNPNHEEMIRFLIDVGVDANRRSNKGSTPLHTAASARLLRNVSVFLHYIGKGVDPSIADFSGKSFVELLQDSDQISLFASLDYSVVSVSAFNYFLWFALIQVEAPPSNGIPNVDYLDRNQFNLDPSCVMGKTAQERYEMLHHQIEQMVTENPELIDAKDIHGRVAIEIASRPFKHIFQAITLWHGRFRVTEGRPEHTSATCCVFKAVDEYDMSSSHGRPRTVALKLMSRKDQFLREYKARRKGFNSDFVVEVLHYYPTLSDEDLSLAQWPDHLDTILTQKLSKINSEKLFLLVMPLGERNLFTALKQERWAGRNAEEVRHVFLQLVHCVKHLHDMGILHADLKPLNFVRSAGQWQLIDLDAASEIGKDFVGHKSSSAFIPPEAIYINPRNGSAAVRTPVSDDPNQKLLAHPSFDIWSLSCILYQMCNIDVLPLFQGNQDDNLSDNPLKEDNLRVLAEWSTEQKSNKLECIHDKLARNLLSQMLQKDPLKRPTIDRLLAHPFLSMKKVARLIGEDAKYDIFLSYRVASDLSSAETLYKGLTNRGLKVFWDKMSLQPGVDWEQGFCEGLVSSRAFVPLLSRGAINHPSNDRQNFSKLVHDSPCDNVFLEYRFAVELHTLGLIEKIFPVFIGDFDASSDYFGHYFNDGCHPSLTPGSPISSVEEKLRHHMDKQALGTPLCPQSTVQQVLSTIIACQGEFIAGSGRDILFQKLIQNIAMMVANTANTPTTNLSTAVSVQNRAQHAGSQILRNLLDAKEAEVQELKLQIEECKNQMQIKDDTIRTLRELNK